MFSTNKSPLSYWRWTGFKDSDVDSLCAELDRKAMFCRIRMGGDGNSHVTISQCLWERKQGHAPTVQKFVRDLCQHPLLQGVSGAFVVWLEDGMWEAYAESSRKAPIFSFGRYIEDTTTLLIPDPAFLEGRGYAEEREGFYIWDKDVPWAQRQETIYWRGAATGLGIESIDDWVLTQRGRLALADRKIHDSAILDAKITRLAHLSVELQDIMLDRGVVGPEVPFDEFFKYKYIVDLDGYCCAWRSLFLKLGSGSVTLKMDSEFEEWYFEELIPWKNYIPLSKSLDELTEVYTWLRNHDDAARGISEAGRELTSKVSYERSLESTARDLRELMSYRKA